MKKCYRYAIVSCCMLLALTMVIGGCAGEESSEELDWKQGELMYVWEAYDRELITREELMSALYYYNEELFDDGRRHNEDIMPEDFVPAPLDPETLSEDIALTIETRFIMLYVSKLEGESTKEYYERLVQYFDLVDITYCGTYGGNIVLLIRTVFRAPAGISPKDDKQLDLVFCHNVGWYPMVWHVKNSSEKK